MTERAVQQIPERLLPSDYRSIQGQEGPRPLTRLLTYDGSHRLLGWFALFMAFGAAYYFTRNSAFTRPEVAAWTSMLLACVAGLGLTGRMGRLVPIQAVLLVCCGGFAMGVAVAGLRTLTTPVVAIAQPMDRVLVEGWVTGIDPREEGARIRIRVHAMSDISESARPPLVRMTQMSGEPPFPGRFVRCYGALRAPPSPMIPGDYDFSRDAHFAGLGAVGFVYGQCDAGGLGEPRKGAWELELASFRRRIAERVDEAAGERAGGFAAALVSGDRSLMAEADREALRASGLAHLLAISGLHLGLVGGMIYLSIRRSLALWEWFALRVPVQKVAAIVALVVLSGYFVMSGMSVATQRAYIMSLVFFGAILFDRPALTSRSLALAMILVLLMQPETVATPGFQMSFAASGALVAAFRLWNQRQANQLANPSFVGKLQGAWAAIALSSLVGTLGTTPFALAHFDRLAPLGLIANLVAMPLVSILVLPAAAISMILTPFGQADLGLHVFGQSLELILLVAHKFADWGSRFAATTPTLPPVGVAALALASLSIGVFAIHEGRALVVPSLIALAAVALWHLEPQPVVKVTAGGWVAIEEDGGDTLYWTGNGRPGLKPLSYSDLDVSPDCNDGCELKLPSSKAKIVFGPRPALCGDRGDLQPSDIEQRLYLIEDRKCSPLDVPQGAVALIFLGNENTRVEVKSLPHRRWTPENRLPEISHSGE